MPLAPACLIVSRMEGDFLHWLRDRLPPHPLLKLGIGDDAALLATAGRRDIVVTTDLIADGIDFNLKSDDPRRIGHKALAINLSDLAAMAAQPLAAVVALNLPRQGGQHLAVELYEGILPLAEQFHLAIAGGDTNSWDGPLVVSITAIGEVGAKGPLCRRGAARRPNYCHGFLRRQHFGPTPGPATPGWRSAPTTAAICITRGNRLQRRARAGSVACMRRKPLRRSR